jgi:hypothetical protein
LENTPRVQYEGYTAMTNEISWGFIEEFAPIVGGIVPVPTQDQLIDVARRNRWRLIRARAVYFDAAHPERDHTVVEHEEESISFLGR